MAYERFLTGRFRRNRVTTLFECSSENPPQMQIILNDRTCFAFKISNFPFFAQPLFEKKKGLPNFCGRPLLNHPAVA